MLDTDIMLLPHQFEYLQSESKIVALIGGYGAAKTFSCVLGEMLAAKYDPECQHVIVSPNLKMAMKTIKPTVFEIMDSFFPWLQYGRSRDWYYFGDHTFHFPCWNNAVIQMIGAHDPDNMKGPNWATCTLDEPGLMDSKVIDQVIARVRDPKAKKHQIRLTGTPEEFNWLADFCEGDSRPAELHLIRARTADNIFLPEGYIESLMEKYDPQMIRAYLNGEFVNLNNSMAYYSFGDSSIRTLTYDPNLPLYIGLDWNWNPNVAIIGQEQLVDGLRCFCVIDEVFMRDATSEAKCEEIISRYPNAEHNLYPDAASQSNNARAVGQSDFDIMERVYRTHKMRYQIHVNRANPLRKDRLNSVNGMLLNGKGQRRLYIDSRCRNLIKDLRQVTRDGMLSGKHKEKDLGHIQDALGYVVHWRYPVQHSTTKSRTSKFDL